MNVSNTYKCDKPKGFTIVELLIVIVVIGILATISIVAYNGISQRAKNTAIINAARDTFKLVQAYVSTEGKYLLPSANATHRFCVTTESGCNDASGLWRRIGSTRRLLRGGHSI